MIWWVRVDDVGVEVYDVGGDVFVFGWKFDNFVVGDGGRGWVGLW